jgi:HSP20 family protein
MRKVKVVIMSLLEEVKKLFSIGETEPETSTAHPPAPPAALAYPATNLWEDDNFVYAEALLPGQKLSDLDISVTVNGDESQLTIKGARKHPKRDKVKWHCRERGFGHFRRTIDLPLALEVDEANQTQAHLENGVLTVKMAKSPQAKPKKIPVKAE